MDWEIADLIRLLDEATRHTLAVPARAPTRVPRVGRMGRAQREKCDVYAQKAICHLRRADAHEKRHATDAANAHYARARSYARRAVCVRCARGTRFGAATTPIGSWTGYAPPDVQYVLSDGNTGNVAVHAAIDAGTQQALAAMYLVKLPLSVQAYAVLDDDPPSRIVSVILPTAVKVTAEIVGECIARANQIFADVRAHQASLAAVTNAGQMRITCTHSGRTYEMSVDVALATADHDVAQYGMGHPRSELQPAQRCLVYAALRGISAAESPLEEIAATTATDVDGVARAATVAMQGTRDNREWTYSSPDASATQIVKGNDLPVVNGIPWFENLFGFAEKPQDEYEGNYEQMEYVRDQNVIRTNGNREFGTGTFALERLDDLRATIPIPTASAEATKWTVIEGGDARVLHAMPEYAGAMFQAASQFNCLEFNGPAKVPENGIKEWVYDATQGPACSIACAGGTLLRHYFHESEPGPGVIGQRSAPEDTQINTLRDVIVQLGVSDDIGVKNGYLDWTGARTHAQREGVKARIEAALGTPATRAAIAGLLSIGVQHRVEVTCQGDPDSKSWRILPKESRQTVSQAYVSAVGLGDYMQNGDLIAPLARLVLDAAYEATLYAALKCGTKRVLLTAVGGGVFGNASDWVASAIARAYDKFKHSGLNVSIVYYGSNRAKNDKLMYGPIVTALVARGGML